MSQGHVDAFLVSPVVLQVDANLDCLITAHSAGSPCRQGTVSAFVMDKYLGGENCVPSFLCLLRLSSRFIYLYLT